MHDSDNETFTLLTLTMHGKRAFFIKLFRFSKIKQDDDVTTIAMPSAKTDVYAFAILAWEILTNLKPFPNITNATELSFVVHQGVRPDINQLPKNCPLAIRHMIESCWDSKRENRLTALQCCITLRECYHVLDTMKYDVYLLHRTNSCHEKVLSAINNRLTQNGLKVARPGMNDIESTVNQKYEIIEKSKIILLCLDKRTQEDWNVILELGNNRAFKRPRPVIPIFLEPQNDSFPNNEIKAQCFLGRPDAKVFDISNLVPVPKDGGKKLNLPEVELSLGVDPIDLELDNLTDHLYDEINNLCVIYNNV